jgi:hypothetical protein
MGAARPAGGPLRAGKSFLALVAEGGEELFDLGPLAGRTAHLLITEDQDLKILIALHTMIFKDGHCLAPVCFFSQYNTAEGFFPVFPTIFSLPLP